MKIKKNLEHGELNIQCTILRKLKHPLKVLPLHSNKHFLIVYIIVFISYYYTIAYVLNGRKVIAKILEIKKK